MRLRLAISAFAVIVAACATRNDPRPVDSAPPIPKPDIRVGDRWTYWQHDVFTQREMTFGETRVVNVDGRAIQTVTKLAASEKEFDAIWTPEWNTVVSPEDEIFKPNSGWLRFPLKAGANYSSAYEVVRRGSATGTTGHQTQERHNATMKVIGWEQVEVPAGKFTALRLEIESQFEHYGGNIRGGGTASLVVWYVPEVKRWVKLTYEDWHFAFAVPARRQNWWTFELVRYSVQ